MKNLALPSAVVIYLGVFNIQRAGQRKKFVPHVRNLFSFWPLLIHNPSHLRPVNGGKPEVSKRIKNIRKAVLQSATAVLDQPTGNGWIKTILPGGTVVEIKGSFMNHLYVQCGSANGWITNENVNVS